MDKENRRKESKAIEAHLYNYTQYKTGIVTLQKQLNYIMPNVTTSFSLSNGNCGTFNVESKTEKVAIDRIESRRALILHEDIQMYSMLIASIDESIKQLEQQERDFLRLRYIERFSIAKVADELGYSEKHIFTIRNKMLDKLLISLKGLSQF